MREREDPFVFPCIQWLPVKWQGVLPCAPYNIERERGSGCVYASFVGVAATGLPFEPEIRGEWEGKKASRIYYQAKGRGQRR